MCCSGCSRTMAKSLSTRIQERAGSSQGLPREQHRATILALRTEIAQAIDEGWSIRTIWRTLRDEHKVRTSYQAFRVQVKQLVQGRRRSVTTNPSSRRTQPKPMSASLGTSRPGFCFAPTAHKEDLV
jgi:hypothetical protein